jgi:hypothetical protein
MMIRQGIGRTLRGVVGTTRSHALVLPITASALPFSTVELDPG